MKTDERSQSKRRIVLQMSNNYIVVINIVVEAMQ
jgi:hypothetical protein